MSKRFFYSLVFVLVIGVLVYPAHAISFPFEIFTSSGNYYNSPGLNIYVEVLDSGPGQTLFVFHNESAITSSITRIYFDDNSILATAIITNGPETSFSQPAKPGNLPAGETLEQPFAADFSFGSNSPPPKNGVNPREWVKITFDLKKGITFNNVIDELNSGTLRIGTHIISLPDGSSESAIAAAAPVPEPATIMLLGFGSLVLLRKRYN